MAVAHSSTALSLEEIVEGGLCIGCGLCKSVAAPEQIQTVLTAEGRERPVAQQALSAAALARINAVCPGTRVQGARPGDQSAGAMRDVVWGAAEHLAIGYASDPQVRHRGMRIDPPSAAAKAGHIPGVRTPITLGDRPMAAERPAPRLGEHGTEILREIGEIP